MFFWKLHIIEILPPSWGAKHCIIASFTFSEKPTTDVIYASLIASLVSRYKDRSIKGLKIKEARGPFILIERHLQQGAVFTDEYRVSLIREEIPFDEPLGIESFLTHSNAFAREAAKAYRNGSVFGFNPREEKDPFR